MQVPIAPPLVGPKMPESLSVASSPEPTALEPEAFLAPFVEAVPLPSARLFSASASARFSPFALELPSAVPSLPEAFEDASPTAPFADSAALLEEAAPFAALLDELPLLKDLGSPDQSAALFSISTGAELAEAT